MENILNNRKFNKKSDIDYIKKSLEKIRNNIKSVAIKDESSLIKNLNPNNDYIFQLMNH